MAHVSTEIGGAGRYHSVLELIAWLEWSTLKWSKFLGRLNSVWYYAFSLRLQMYIYLSLTLGLSLAPPSCA
jgi:hypothetical protein